MFEKANNLGQNTQVGKTNELGQNTQVGSSFIGYLDPRKNHHRIKEYITYMNNTELFDELSPGDQNKVIFSSAELLWDYFPDRKVTIRAVALQVLFSLEGEEEEYAKLKRHGVKQYAVKGVSVTFEGSGISSDVIRLIEGPTRAKVKRLI